MDFEVDAQLVPLKGQFQFPDDVAIGDKTVKGKMMFGRIETALLNQLMLGDATVAGIKAINSRESHTIPTTPYQVTITPPHAGVFGNDLGVIYTATGVALTQVPSAPITGQYSVVLATGIYTFAAADTTLGVLISYTSTDATAGAITQQIGNQNMGYGPTCEVWAACAYQDTRNGLHLPAVKFGKLSAPLKRDGYMIQTLDYEAYASATQVTANGAPLVAEFFQISA